MTILDKIKKFVTIGIIAVFLFYPGFLFADPQDWGISGNQISFDVNTSGSNFNFNVAGQTTTWTPGASFTDSISSNASLQNYISGNMIQETDWGQLALTMGVSVATAYLGSCLSSAVQGAWNTAGTSGAFGGAIEGISGVSMAETVNTALISQAMGTGLGQIGREEGWDASDTYLASAAMSSLVGFGYGGGFDSLFSSEITSNPLVVTAGASLYVGAPVLGAWYITSQVDDEDLARGDIPVVDQAIGAAIGIAGSAMGRSLVLADTYRTPELYNAKEYEMKFMNHAEGDYFSNNYSAADDWLSDPSIGSYNDYAANGMQTLSGQSFGPVSEVYFQVATGQAPAVLNVSGLGGGSIGDIAYLAYNDSFDFGNFAHNVFVKPAIEGLVGGLGDYLRISARDVVKDALTESYGKHDWRTYVASSMANMAIGGLWQPVTNLAMYGADYYFAPDAMRNYKILQRQNAYANMAIQLAYEDEFVPPARADYKGYLRSKLRGSGYDQLMEDIGQSSWNIFARQALKTGITSTLEGAVFGAIEALNYEFVQHRWLGLDRYDDMIETYEYDYNNLANLGSGWDQGLDLDQEQIGNINGLSSSQQQAIVNAYESGSGFGSLPEELQEIEGVREYYNSLADAAGSIRYAKSQRYKLNLDTQAQQLLASFGTNLASSFVSGLVSYAGNSYFNSDGVYNFTSPDSTFAPQQPATLWESVSTSLAKSINSSLWRGFSLGAYRGGNYSAANWNSYTSNLASYIRYASYGFSIPAAALTQANLNTASKNITGSLLLAQKMLFDGDIELGKSFYDPAQSSDWVSDFMRRQDGGKIPINNPGL